MRGRSNWRPGSWRRSGPGSRDYSRGHGCGEDILMSDAKWWLVCYDVRDAKRLRKCAKHMEGYGERIQYSIFRCWMSKLELERLRWELTELLESDDEVML